MFNFAHPPRFLLHRPIVDDCCTTWCSRYENTQFIELEFSDDIHIIEVTCNLFIITTFAFLKDLLNQKPSSYPGKYSTMQHSLHDFPSNKHPLMLPGTRSCPHSKLQQRDSIDNPSIVSLFPQDSLCSKNTWQVSEENINYDTNSNDSFWLGKIVLCTKNIS